MRCACATSPSPGGRALRLIGTDDGVQSSSSPLSLFTLDATSRPRRDRTPLFASGPKAIFTTRTSYPRPQPTPSTSRRAALAQPQQLPARSGQGGTTNGWLPLS